MKVKTTIERMIQLGWTLELNEANVLQIEAPELSEKKIHGLKWLKKHRKEVMKVLLARKHERTLKTTMDLTFHEDSKGFYKIAASTHGTLLEQLWPKVQDPYENQALVKCFKRMENDNELPVYVELEGKVRVLDEEQLEKVYE